MVLRRYTSLALSLNRQERIAFQGWGTRAFLGIIAAGAVEVVDFATIQNGRHEKYLPFDSLVINNNSGQRLTVLLSNGIGYGVLAAQSVTREGPRISFTHFTITNNDVVAATAANEVEWIAERTPADADRKARLELAQRGV